MSFVDTCYVVVSHVGQQDDVFESEIYLLIWTVPICLATHAEA